MLRIHFTPEDLTRVTVARGPDFLWEITNSVQTLQRTDGERVFGAWRRWVRPRLPESRLLLSPLLPAYGYSPDFLTPTSGDRSTLQAAVDTLLGTERPRLRAELARLARSRRLPGWTRALAEGDKETLGRLGEALHAYQAEALVPHWHQVRADIDADRARRMESLMDGGTEALLAGLGPGVRWRPPVLEVDYPVDQQLRLRGRGLLLQPSFFCWPARPRSRTRSCRPSWSIRSATRRTGPPHRPDGATTTASGSSSAGPGPPCCGPPAPAAPPWRPPGCSR